MQKPQQYTPEFKLAAVKLVLEQGLSRGAVGRDLGIQSKTVGRWVREYQAKQETAFPGHGHARDEEMSRLRRENAVLQMERDILKKALGIFSQMPKL